LEETHKNKYRISFAKTGTSFNDETRLGRGKQQLLYCSNPSRKALGMKIWVKSNTGKTKAMYEAIKTQFNLEESENISIIKNKDLVLEYGVYIELKDRYAKLLAYIINELS
jgi:hypothetical protein